MKQSVRIALIICAALLLTVAAVLCGVAVAKHHAPETAEESSVSSDTAEETDDEEPMPTEMLHKLAQAEWGAYSEFLPDYEYDPYAPDVSRFNPDGSAVVISVGDGAAGSWYHKVWYTYDYGEHWTPAEDYLQHSSCQSVYNCFFLPSEDLILFSVACPDEGYRGFDDERSGLCYCNETGDYNELRMSWLIPGYEKNKNVIISNIEETKSGTYVISFEDITTNPNGEFYFCGEYDRALNLLRELKPVDAE